MENGRRWLDATGEVVQGRNEMVKRDVAMKTKARTHRSFKETENVEYTTASCAKDGDEMRKGLWSSASSPIRDHRYTGTELVKQLRVGGTSVLPSCNSWFMMQPRPAVNMNTKSDIPKNVDTGIYLLFSTSTVEYNTV
jgi:hypothetical protein